MNLLCHRYHKTDTYLKSSSLRVTNNFRVFKMLCKDKCQTESRDNLKRQREIGLKGAIHL